MSLRARSAKAKGHTAAAPAAADISFSQLTLNAPRTAPLNTVGRGAAVAPAVAPAADVPAGRKRVQDLARDEKALALMGNIFNALKTVQSDVSADPTAQMFLKRGLVHDTLATLPPSGERVRRMLNLKRVQFRQCYKHALTTFSLRFPVPTAQDGAVVNPITTVQAAYRLTTGLLSPGVGDAYDLPGAPFTTPAPAPEGAKPEHAAAAAALAAEMKDKAVEGRQNFERLIQAYATARSDLVNVAAEFVTLDAGDADTAQRRDQFLTHLDNAYLTGCAENVSYPYRAQLLQTLNGAIKAYEDGGQHATIPYETREVVARHAYIQACMMKKAAPPEEETVDSVKSNAERFYPGSSQVRALVDARDLHTYRHTLNKNDPTRDAADSSTFLDETVLEIAAIGETEPINAAGEKPRAELASRLCYEYLKGMRAICAVPADADAEVRHDQPISMTHRWNSQVFVDHYNSESNTTKDYFGRAPLHEACMKDFVESMGRRWDKVPATAAERTSWETGGFKKDYNTFGSSGMSMHLLYCVLASQTTRTPTVGIAVEQKRKQQRQSKQPVEPESSEDEVDGASAQKAAARKKARAAVRNASGSGGAGPSSAAGSLEDAAAVTDGGLELVAAQVDTDASAESLAPAAGGDRGRVLRSASREASAAAKAGAAAEAEADAAAEATGEVPGQPAEVGADDDSMGVMGVAGNGDLVRELQSQATLAAVRELPKLVNLTQIETEMKELSAQLKQIQQNTTETKAREEAARKQRKEEEAKTEKANAAELRKQLADVQQQLTQKLDDKIGELQSALSYAQTRAAVAQRLEGAAADGGAQAQGATFLEEQQLQAVEMKKRLAAHASQLKREEMVEKARIESNAVRARAVSDSAARAARVSADAAAADAAARRASESAQSALDREQRSNEEKVWLRKALAKVDTKARLRAKQLEDIAERKRKKYEEREKEKKQRRSQEKQEKLERMQRRAEQAKVNAELEEQAYYAYTLVGAAKEEVNDLYIVCAVMATDARATGKRKDANEVAVREKRLLETREDAKEIDVEATKAYYSNNYERLQELLVQVDDVVRQARGILDEAALFGDDLRPNPDDTVAVKQDKQQRREQRDAIIQARKVAQRQLFEYNAKELVDADFDELAGLVDASMNKFDAVLENCNFAAMHGLMAGAKDALFQRTLWGHIANVSRAGFEAIKGLCTIDNVKAFLVSTSTYAIAGFWGALLVTAGWMMGSQRIFSYAHEIPRRFQSFVRRHPNLRFALETLGTFGQVLDGALGFLIDPQETRAARALQTTVLASIGGVFTYMIVSNLGSVLQYTVTVLGGALVANSPILPAVLTGPFTYVWNILTAEPLRWLLESFYRVGTPQGAVPGNFWTGPFVALGQILQRLGWYLSTAATFTAEVVKEAVLAVAAFFSVPWYVVVLAILAALVALGYVFRKTETIKELMAAFAAAKRSAVAGGKRAMNGVQAVARRRRGNNRAAVVPVAPQGAIVMARFLGSSSTSRLDAHWHREDFFMVVAVGAGASGMLMAQT